MRIEEVHAEVGANGKGLVVKAVLREDGREVPEARLPARETAALLPREYLAGEAASLPASCIEAADEILAKLIIGRRVRLWEYEGRVYFSFLPWRSVSASPPPAERQTSGA